VVALLTGDGRVTTTGLGCSTQLHGENEEVGRSSPMTKDGRKKWIWASNGGER
jgi:hypothetical protein